MFVVHRARLSWQDRQSQFESECDAADCEDSSIPPVRRSPCFEDVPGRCQILELDDDLNAAIQYAGEAKTDGIAKVNMQSNTTVIFPSRFGR